MSDIRDVRQADKDEWTDIWKGCEYATFYHSWEWADLWMHYTKGKLKPNPLLVEFYDGKKALLPFSRNNDEWISSPAGTFGGWISSDSLEIEHAKQLKKYLEQNHRMLYWRLNPYDPHALQLNLAVSHDDVTYTLSLLNGFEALLERWSHGHRAAVRKANNAGVVVREAETLQDWKDYFKVYEDSLRRWGERATSRYEWAWFEHLYERNSSQITLWLAEYDGKVIAGSLVLYAAHHAGAWHGASLEAYFKMRPAILIKYESIRHACEHGYHWFDFNPSGGHAGVSQFKKRFGPLEKQAPVVRLV